MDWGTIWHQTQFGTKSEKEPIWHQEWKRSQFGTGPNLAPRVWKESIWHRSQFGTKSVKGLIWHRYQFGTGQLFRTWGPLRAQRKEKLFNTGLLLPTFKEGIVCFVSGGPYGPKWRGTSLILDFYCQHLRRVLFVLCLGALTGPGEFCQILRLYYVVNIMLLIC